MSNFWKDRHEIHSSEQVTGTIGGEWFAQLCGNLDRDPELRETRLRSADGDVQSLVEVRFGISVPSITPGAQECVAFGELAELIGAEKKGQRLRIIGRFKYREGAVVVHTAKRYRISGRSIPG
jgi:single-stranded DNA-binding protein